MLPRGGEEALCSEIGSNLVQITVCGSRIAICWANRESQENGKRSDRYLTMLLIHVDACNR